VVNRVTVILMDRLLPRRPSREIEVAWALAIGFFLNGFLLVTRASAEPVIAGPIGLILNSYGFAGALGGLTLALIHFIGQAFASPQVAPYAVKKAAAEGLAAILIGAIVSHFFTGYVGLWIPRADPADLLWLAYAIGVFAWRALPIFIEKIPLFVAAISERIMGGLKGVFGQGGSS
jgi:hypothetical protein